MDDCDVWQGVCDECWGGGWCSVRELLDMQLFL